MQEANEVTQSEAITAEVSFVELSNSINCLTSDNLHYFRIKGLQYVAELHAPEIFKIIELFEDHQIDEIEDILEQQTDKPTSFLEALGIILLIRESNLIEQLDTENIKRIGEESDGELLCRLYRHENEKFKRIVSRLESSLPFNGVSYLVTSLTRPLLNNKNFFKSKKVQDMLKEECSTYFKDSGYTDHCLIKIFDDGKREGFFVERGSNPKSMAVLEKGERRNRLNNERKIDRVFFDKENETIWTNVSGQRACDIKFLKELAVKILTGNSKAYKDFDFNYEILRSKDLKEKLTKRRGYSDKIILKEVAFIQEANSCISSPLKTAPRSRKDCLIDKSNYYTLINDINVLTGVVLKVYISEENNFFDKVTVKSGKIYLGGTLQLEDVMDLLSSLRIVQGRIDA